MNSVEPNKTINALWTKEAAILIMADMQWKAIDLKARLKSPYPLLFFYHVEPQIIDQSEIQPYPNP